MERGNVLENPKGDAFIPDDPVEQKRVPRKWDAQGNLIALTESEIAEQTKIDAQKLGTPDYPWYTDPEFSFAEHPEWTPEERLLVEQAMLNLDQGVEELETTRIAHDQLVAFMERNKQVIIDGQKTNILDGALISGMIEAGLKADLVYEMNQGFTTEDEKARSEAVLVAMAEVGEATLLSPVNATWIKELLVVGDAWDALGEVEGASQDDIDTARASLVAQMFPEEMASVPGLPQWIYNVARSVFAAAEWAGATDTQRAKMIVQTIPIIGEFILNIVDSYERLAALVESGSTDPVGYVTAILHAIPFIGDILEGLILTIAAPKPPLATLETSQLNIRDNVGPDSGQPSALELVQQEGQ